MRPDLVHSVSTIPDGRPTLAQALSILSKELGFTPNPGNPASRQVYLAAKTWRQRFFGMIGDKPVSLRIDSHRLPVEEETMRDKFRSQIGIGRIFPIRPPNTYDWQPFDARKGYGWSLDEIGGDDPVFRPDQDPAQASRAFLEMYHELRSAIRTPFWHVDIASAAELSQQQVALWRARSSELVPGYAEKHASLLERLEQAFVSQQQGVKTCFMHAHLAGPDVRRKNGEYLVFANHFWSWRQPGYDIAFAIWSQWMSLSFERRTPSEVAHITNVWLQYFQKERPDYAKGVKAMLLNRCFGSLLLDIPLKYERESPEVIQVLETAIVAEAKRLLAE